MRVLAPLTAAFDALKIPFFVGGSVASSVHGLIRTTQDLDVVADLREDQIALLAAALGTDFEVDEEALREAVRRRWSANLFYMPEFTRIDLYVPERSPFNDSRMLRRVRMMIAGIEVPVSSPEDTILKKLEWYRKGNEISQRQWEDVTAVIRVQGSRLDLEYLRKWAPALAVTDLLERALSQGA